MCISGGQTENHGYSINFTCCLGTSELPWPLSPSPTGGKSEKMDGAHQILNIFVFFLKGSFLHWPGQGENSHLEINSKAFCSSQKGLPSSEICHHSLIGGFPKTKQ